MRTAATHGRPPDEHPFRLRDGAARREAGAGRRRLPQGRPPLRPDERPDVGRAAPGLEGRAGRRRCGPPRDRPFAHPRRRRRHRRHRLPHRSTPAGRRRDVTVARHQRRHARPSGASARRATARRPARLRRGAMPRRCRSPTERSTPTPSPSASATCRASSRRSREAYRVLQARRPLPVPRILAGRRAGLDALYDAYSFNAIPRARRLVTGDGEPLPLPRRIDPPLPAPGALRAA